jgi:acetolactate synthase regulatory subunit
MRDVRVGRIFQHRGVEMSEIALNELADAAHLHITNFKRSLLLLMQNFQRISQALIASF